VVVAEASQALRLLRLVVSIGSDVAFAMAEGTVKKTWICRARNILKGKNKWRRNFFLGGDLPDDMYAVCEWYSLISRTRNLHYHFCDVADLAKYSLKYIIGLVRIGLVIDESASNSSSKGRYTISKGRYTISIEQLSLPEVALKLTTPLARGSKTAVGESRKKRKYRRRNGPIIERVC
jgi:hypothetical protein